MSHIVDERSPVVGKLAPKGGLPSNRGLKIQWWKKGPTMSRKTSLTVICLMFLSLSHLPAFADHIHHLWYNNSNWQDVDLTALTGGPNSVAFGAIAAFRTTPNNQLHVYYVDFTSNHVHQLFYNGTNWSDSDLSALVGGPAAYPYGISGFSIGNLQYVYYVSAN